MIELIADGEKPLAYVIRLEREPTETSFLTPGTSQLQVGYVVRAAGGEVLRHSHRPVERRLVGTAEVLFVKKGRCEMDVYDDEQRLVATRVLQENDVMIMVGGGHAFRMIEDTVFLEIKQGPYGGSDEKELF